MKQNSALVETDTTFKFIIYPAVACVRACVHMQWGEQMGADPRVWVPPPRHHGAPPFQWKQVGSPHSANHAASRCGRRVRGREAGPIQLILPRIHRRKSQENTSIVLWRSFCSHTCGFSGVLEGVSSGAEDRRKAVLSRSNVGTLRRDEKHSVNGSELVSLSCSSWITVC